MADENNNDQGTNNPEGQNDNEGNEDQSQDQGEEVKVIKQEDGTVIIDGKKYVNGESYEALAKKQREHTKNEEARKQKEEAEKQKRLEEEGKFKELAETKTKEADTIKKRYERQIKVNALQAKAVEAGAIDLDAVVKLANLSEIELSEDGNVNEDNVKTVLDSLKENKAYLFSSGQNKNIGNDGGGAPEGGNKTVLKRSQLQDYDFYKKHEEAINKGEVEIIDDIDED